MFFYYICSKLKDNIMKKIYVMAAFLGASSLAFSQVQKAPLSYDIERVAKKTTSNYQAKALGTEIWSSDFSDPTTDWIIQSPGNQGTWEFGNTTDLPPYSFVVPVPSPTAANGIAFFSGIDFLVAESVETQESWIEMANSVDCSTDSIVTLRFFQAYNAFNHDQTLVEVSLDDGDTWVQSIDINPDVDANADATEVEVYRNFIVNHSSTVKFRFRWLNESDDDAYGAGYVWQIDDVSISTLSDNDISTGNHNFGTDLEGTVIPYAEIPLAQVAPIMGSVIVTNQGINNQPNVVLNAVEVGGAYTSTSASKDIVAGASDSLVLGTAFTPNAIGDYTINYSITADSTDDIPSNNILKSYKFTVGEHLYIRDRGGLNGADAQGSMSGAKIGEYGELIEPANVFDIITSAEVTGIDFKFG